MIDELEESTMLGRTLVRRGTITDAQREELLEQQKLRTNGTMPRLGDVAVAIGMITDDQLDEALRDQMAWRGPEQSDRAERAMERMHAQVGAIDHMVDDFNDATKRTKTNTMMVVKISPES
jgi:hypothetical protein